MKNLNLEEFTLQPHKPINRLERFALLLCSPIGLDIKLIKRTLKRAPYSLNLIA